jgi:6-carboxyhexanoate--CoA ligase
MVKNPTLYSLRMKASREGSHISGAERILSKDRIPIEMEDLFRRAMDHGLGSPDEIHLTIEEIKEDIMYAESLPISTILTEEVEDSRKKAMELLILNGVSEQAIRRAFDDISMGASPDNKNMRGAMIIDMDTGERLEPDLYRGVRVSRMDIGEEAEEALKIEMKRINVKGQRVKEALTLATKVALAGTFAEICWSDNPDYTTGYVASKRHGYVRFLNLKKDGDPYGGRAFFVKSKMDLDSYIDFLQKSPLIITKIIPGFSPCPLKEFLKRYED